jgi:hypothetical protein
MSALVRRRASGLATVAVFSGLAILAAKGYRLSLGNPSFVTGWVLMGVVLFLAAYTVRKKVPTLPLGSSRLWLQIHCYTGLFSVVLYFVHAGLRLPSGLIESTLGLLFCLVALSGIVGLFMTRLFPRRLTSKGGEVVYEAIPEHRMRLKQAADSLAEESIEHTGFTTVSRYYEEQLQSFFAGPKNYVAHLLEVAAPRRRLLREMEEKERYLNAKEKEYFTRLAEQVEEKDRLDYQYALQRTLKLWLFVHIPLTYGLLVLAGTHVLVVYVFSVAA